MYHILPKNDLEKHILDEYCWCEPDVQRDAETGETVVEHNAMDGRHLIEGLTGVVDEKKQWYIVEL